MKRRIVVFHDVNPQAFAMMPPLRRLLGDRLRVIRGGSEGQPEPSAKLLVQILDQAESASAIATGASVPITRPPDELVVRSVFPVAHPVLRTLRRMERLAAVAAETAGRAATPAAIAAELVQRLGVRMPAYPLLNFHAGFLLGGLRLVSTETASELAERLVEAVQFGLADFPSLLHAQVVGELLGAGAALDGSVTLSADPASDLLESLRHWQRRLPAQLFDRLCRASEPDLAFFDCVATAVQQRAPLPAAGRERMRAVLDEAAAITGHREAAGRRQSAPPPQPAEPKLYEPDPVLGWRLKPGGSLELAVSGQSVTMQADHSGCRTVPGQPPQGEKIFAAYGCSCVYGWAVATEETFCGLLQARLPAWRIENHGMNGFGQIHNLIQLTRDLRWEPPDVVMFGWVAEHLVRNVADVGWIQQRTGAPTAGRQPPRKVTPRAYLAEDGTLHYREVAFLRPDLAGLDLSDFRTDPHYMDQVCLATVQRAASLVRQAGGHFFLAILFGQPSAWLRANLEQSAIPVLDASVTGPEYRSALDGIHPSPLAHRVYAERIHDYLSQQPELAST